MLNLSASSCAHHNRLIALFVGFVDVYLMGMVMLIFGMGLYELFVSSLEVADGIRTPLRGSNMFGLFHLMVITTSIPQYVSSREIVHGKFVTAFAPCFS